MSYESHQSVLRFAFEAKSLVTELNGALARAFRPLGLTGVQAEALMVLDALGESTLKELSENLVAEAGHPSRLVSKLVDLGWVVRTPAQGDARAVELRLTERGRELAAQARAAREPLVEECVRLYGDRLGETTRLLEDIRVSLREF